MAKATNYDKKIAVISARIERTSGQLKALKDELKGLQDASRKARYSEMVDFVDSHNLPMDDVMDALHMIAEDLIRKQSA